jgi:chromosome segregation ATPase
MTEQTIITRDDLLEKIHLNDLNISNLKSNIDVHLSIIDRLDKTVEGLRDLAEATHTLISVHDVRLDNLNNQVQDSKIDGKALFIKLTSIENQIQISNNDRQNFGDKLDRLDARLVASELDRKELNRAVDILNVKIEERLLSLEKPAQKEKRDSLKFFMDNWRLIGIIGLVLADLIFDVTNHKVGYLIRLLIGSS